MPSNRLNFTLKIWQKKELKKSNFCKKLRFVMVNYIIHDSQGQNPSNYVIRRSYVVWDDEISRDFDISDNSVINHQKAIKYAKEQIGQSSARF